MEGETNGSGLSWWICGPASYTLENLPKQAPENHRFVYALGFSNQTVKIGMTTSPRDRIKRISTQASFFGEVKLDMIGLSHPCLDYKTLESSLHENFDQERLKGELFKCHLDAVAFAIANGATRPIRITKREGRGRPAKPWFWTERNGWYATVAGKRRFLGQTEAEARVRMDFYESRTKYGPTREALVLDKP